MLVGIVWSFTISAQMSSVSVVTIYLGSHINEVLFSVEIRNPNISSDGQIVAVEKDKF